MNRFRIERALQRERRERPASIGEKGRRAAYGNAIDSYMRMRVTRLNESENLSIFIDMTPFMRQSRVRQAATTSFMKHSNVRQPSGVSLIAIRTR